MGRGQRQRDFHCFLHEFKELWLVGGRLGGSVGQASGSGSQLRLISVVSSSPTWGSMLGVEST